MDCGDQLREAVWPHKELWGDKRIAVRTYLIKEWKKNHLNWSTVETTRENIEKEKDFILQWWWTNYKQPGQVNTTNSQFGQWLLTKYLDFIKVDSEDSKQWGRNP